MGLGLVVVQTHLLRTLISVFVDPSASFHDMVGSLLVRFVCDSPKVNERLWLGGDTLLRCSSGDGGGDVDIVMTSGFFLGFVTLWVRVPGWLAAYYPSFLVSFSWRIL